MSMRILIIGVGSIGERHVRCFRRIPGVEVGVCETSGKQRERVCAAHSIREGFRSLEDALTSPWDAAVIATPAHTHIPIASRLIVAHVPSMIEKPLSVDESGVAELVALAATYGVTMGVAYVYRSHPSLAAMRSAINDGRFGRPLQLIATVGSPFAFHRPGYASTYYSRHESGGGAVQDALTHTFNACEWLVGPVTRLAADAAHQQLVGVTVEDTVGVIGRHGRVLATYTLNQYQTSTESSITVVCESGTVRFEMHKHRWLSVTQPEGAWEEYPAGVADRDDWFTAQAQAWCDAVQGHASPRCTLAEAAQTLLTTHAVLRSISDEGKWQTLTPQD